MEVNPNLFEDKSSEFHLKEYDCLRREIELHTQEARSLERNSLIAVGAIWAWLLHNAVKDAIPAWAFFIPCLFSVLRPIRAYGINQTFDELGEYIREIENSFHKVDGPRGWEHFNSERNEGEGTPEDKGAFVFWVILNLATFTVAILRVFKVF